MANSLWTQIVFFFLITECIYQPLVIFIHVFSSIIIFTSLLDTFVKTKYWNQFTIDTPGLAFILIYNNSASSVLLVYNPSHNITSHIDLSNNFLSLNNYGTLFLWTSSRNSHHSPSLILSQLQSTGSPSRQSLSLPMILSHLFILHVFSKHGIPFHVISDRGSEFMSNFFHSLGTVLDMWLHLTLDYHSESDGQTEHTNQILEQYLYIYCNYQQNNQSELLPLTKFAYNNTLSATTSVSPFFANKEYHLNITVHPKYDIAFS